MIKIALIEWLDAAEIPDDEQELKDTLESLRLGCLHISCGIVLEENTLGIVLSRDMCHELGDQSKVNYPIFIPWGMVEEVSYFDVKVSETRQAERI